MGRCARLTARVESACLLLACKRKDRGKASAACGQSRWLEHAKVAAARRVELRQHPLGPGLRLDIRRAAAAAQLFRRPFVRLRLAVAFGLGEHTGRPEQVDRPALHDAAIDTDAAARGTVHKALPVLDAQRRAARSHDQHVVEIEVVEGPRDPLEVSFLAAEKCCKK